jgi:hypothetical protein
LSGIGRGWLDEGFGAAAQFLDEKAVTTEFQQ